MQLPLMIVEETCQRLLRQVGAPPTVAVRVVEALIDSELEGYSSHGLLRLPEYVSAIQNGLIQLHLDPSVEQYSSGSVMVDGQRAFGVLAADRVRTELHRLLADEPIAIVGLCNSNHIGRLAHIVYPLAKQGYITIAFLNYLGSGQKVPPWGGSRGRLCTNPIAFGFPSASSKPIVVDMSTSTVSEGKIRQAAIDGCDIPEGWLIDEEWQPVRKPQRLYTDPPTAYLAPLGAVFGYKGFALGIAAEILAGSLTGAGCARAIPGPGGNGGLFIGMRTNLFGCRSEQVILDMDALASYCRSCPPSPGFDPIRMPGEASQDAVEEGRRTETVRVSDLVWQQIIALEQQVRIDR